MIRFSSQSYRVGRTIPHKFMQIIELQEKPIHRIQFLNAAKRGGVESQVLSITKARVDSLPNSLEAILVTGDLQGVVKVWQMGATRLLGEALADEYITLAQEGLVPNPANTGVLLAGNFYSAPDGSKRGASGDMRSVWQAFANHFRWVAGVQGNHDDFGTRQERQEFEDDSRVHLIDFDVVKLEGLSVGGVGGVMGDPTKLGRKDESEYLTGLESVLKSKPDVVVLHQGPTGHELQRGSSLVTETVLKNPVPLVVCGHVHWDEALATLGNKTQVLNVDMRAIVLTTQFRIFPCRASITTQHKTVDVVRVTLTLIFAPLSVKPQKDKTATAGFFAGFIFGVFNQPRDVVDKLLVSCLPKVKRAGLKMRGVFLEHLFAFGFCKWCWVFWRDKPVRQNICVLAAQQGI